MAITMYQSDRNFVTPANDASLYSALGGDTSGVLRRGNMLKITTNGLTATVDTGQVVVLGRLVEVTTPTQVTLPANSQGQLCIVVDLSKTNDVTGNAGDANYAVTVNQVYLTAVTGALTQDDINNGGFIYELPLGTFTSTATTASVIQNNPIINDSGWNNLDIGAVNSKLSSDGSSYAQYRVRDNVMYIRFRGVDVSGAANGNQIARVPWAYRPDVEIAAAIMNAEGGNLTSAIAFLNSTATLWVQAYGNKYLTGSMSYPLPMK